MAGLLTSPRHKWDTAEAERDVMRPGGERASAPSPLHHKHSGVFTVRTVWPELRSACAASPCVRGQGDVPRAHTESYFSSDMWGGWTFARSQVEIWRICYGEDHSLHGGDVHCCRSDRGLAVGVGTDHCGGRVLWVLMKSSAPPWLLFCIRSDYFNCWAHLRLCDSAHVSSFSLSSVMLPSRVLCNYI